MSAVRFRHGFMIELWPEDQGDDRDLTCQYHTWPTANSTLIGLAVDTLTEPPGSPFRGLVIVTGSNEKNVTATAQRIVDRLDERRSWQAKAGQ